MNMKKLNKRKFQFGAASTLITILFIVGVVLVNILVGVLADKFSLSLDLTSEKIYDLSGETADYLKKLSDPITITAFASPDRVNPTDKQLVGQIENVMKKYDQLSDKVTYEVKNLTEDPTYAQKYQKDGITLNTFSVVVESGKRYKVLSMTEMVQYDQQGNTISGLKAEQKLTSALMYVTTEDVPSFVFTTGHDEGEAQGLINLGIDNNYKTGVVNLLNEDPTEDTQIVVIYEPERDFSASEIEKLDTFLSKGNKGLMVYLSPDKPILPVLEDYLAEWGLATGHDLILDSKYSWSQPYNIVLAYSEHAITKDLVERNAFAVGSLTGSVKQLFTEKGDYTTYPLLTSSPNSYAKSLANGPVLNETSKQAGDAAGPFTVAAGSRKMTSGKGTAQYSDVILFPSSQIASDNMLAASTFTNAQIMANAIGYIRGNQDLISIATKYYDSSEMQITAEEANVYLIFFLYVIPIIFIICAIVVFVRRRHL